MKGSTRAEHGCAGVRLHLSGPLTPFQLHVDASCLEDVVFGVALGQESRVSYLLGDVDGEVLEVFV